MLKVDYTAEQYRRLYALFNSLECQPTEDERFMYDDFVAAGLALKDGDKYDLTVDGFVECVHYFKTAGAAPGLHHTRPIRPQSSGLLVAHQDDARNPIVRGLATPPEQL